MRRIVSPEHQSVKFRQTIIVPALSVAIALGGCSADLVRFDSPEFSLNGDTSAVDDRVADTSKDSTLYNERVSSGPVGAGHAASGHAASGPGNGNAHVAAPAQPSSSKVQRIARAEPAVEAPKSDTAGVNQDAYTPMATGALPARESITVQPGDTLYQISRRYGVSVRAIRQANGITGNVIRPGQKLVLPGRGQHRDPNLRQATLPERSTQPTAPNPHYRREAPSTWRPPADRPASGQYVVRRGDSLYAISRRTGVSVAELKRLNGITNVRAIRPGLRLMLSGGPGQRYAQQPATRPEPMRDDRRDLRSDGRPDLRPDRRPETRVASRSEIRSKSIKTMPIVREKSQAVTGPNRPYILNQRPDVPIATKPQHKVALAPPASTVEKFRWPARGRVIAVFNQSGKGTKNDGVNIALPLGADVSAAGDGVVAYAGSELKDYGNLVLVRHDNGWVSAYAHASQVLVKRGDRVNRGQVIAKAGRSGGVTQPQLHFELRKGAKPVDPMPHLEQL